LWIKAGGEPGLAEHNAFYQKVAYYDIVFDRDVSKEVDFLLEIYRQHAGREAAATLDIACGPGYHAREVARRGLRSVGIDLRPEMIDFARERAQTQNLHVDLQAADMRNFRLAQAVDLAFIAFDGLDALVENSDLVSHLQTVAANLTSKGIYVIDVTHPRDNSLSKYGTFHYRGQRNGTAVEILWATNHPRVDMLTGVAQTEIEIRVEENGRRTVIKDSARERVFTPQELVLLSQLSGCFRVAAWYGDYVITQPFDDTEASRRLIAVLQKND
jgi:SAM-dependent methyltransferase